MRRSLLLMSLVTSALSVPALAAAPEDAVMLAPDADPGVALAGIGDGSVRFVSENVDLTVYRAASTRDRREALSMP